MNLFELIFLGIIQGLSEFLPISSSGHLALTQIFLEIDQLFLLSISVHFGTLLSLIVFYRKTLIQSSKNIFSKPSKNVALKIIVASLPTFIAGFFLYDMIKKIFNHIQFTALGFLVSGFFLLGTFWFSKKETDINSITYKQAFMIGLAQIFALVPGVSRAGVTISTGIFFGLGSAQAVKFSFLMAIITLSGACLLEFSKMPFETQLLLPLLTCITVSFAVGYGALYLMRLYHYQLYKFSFYLLPLGSAVLLYSFLT